MRKHTELRQGDEHALWSGLEKIQALGIGVLGHSTEHLTCQPLAGKGQHLVNVKLGSQNLFRPLTQRELVKPGLSTDSLRLIT